MGGFQLQKSSEIHLRAFFLPHFCFVLVAFANAHTNCDVWKCVCRAWFSSGHELEVYLSVPKLACTFPPTPYIWILPLQFEKTLIQLNSQRRHHFLHSLWQTPSSGFARSAVPMRHFKWSKKVGARITILCCTKKARGLSENLCLVWSNATIIKVEICCGCGGVMSIG